MQNTDDFKDGKKFCAEQLGDIEQRHESFNHSDHGWNSWK